MRKSIVKSTFQGLFAISLAFGSFWIDLLARPLVYQDRPFVSIVHTLEELPEFGFATDFSAAQLVGRQVVFLPVDHNGQSTTLLANAGGDSRSVWPLPDNALLGTGPITRLGEKLIHRGDSLKFTVLGKGPDGEAQLLTILDGTITSTQTLIPSHQGNQPLTFDQVDHLISVNGEVYFFATVSQLNQAPLRGIYRLQNDQAVAIVDSRLIELTEPRFDFDGQTFLFVGNLELPTLFSYDSKMGIRPLISENDPIPNTPHRILRLIGKPSIEGESSVIGALLDTQEVVLLRIDRGTTEILVRPGTHLSDDDQILNLNPENPMISGGRVYFEANTHLEKQGIFSIEERVISTVIDNTIPLVGDTPPTLLQLMDSTQDGIVVKATTAGLISLHASLAMPDRPVIYQAPQDPIIVSPGDDTTFFTSTAGLPPLRYEWRHKGQLLDDTTPNLALSNISTNHAGTYHLTASNSNGSDTISIQLDVASSPIILNHSLDQQLFAEAPILLSVETRGSPTLDYRWFRDGVELPEQTTATIWIESASLSDSGHYHVVVSNMLGSATSPSMLVTVDPIPPNPSFEHGPFHEILRINQPLADQSTRGSLLDFESFPADQNVLVVARFENSPDQFDLISIAPTGRSKRHFSTLELSQHFPHSFDGIRQPFLNPSAGTITFSATLDRVPIGIYRFSQNAFLQLVAPDSAVPNQPLQSYRGLTPKAVHYGSTVFSAILNRTDTSGIYQTREDHFMTVANEQTSLPDGFGGGSRVEFLASNGYQHLFQKQTTDVPPDFGVFIKDSRGMIQLVLRRDQSIADRTGPFHSCIVAEASTLRFFLLARMSDFQNRLLEYQDGALRTLVAPGDRVSNGSLIAHIKPSRPHFESGRLFFTASISPDEANPLGSKTRDAILFVDPTGVHSVMTAEFLSGQRSTNVELVHVYDRTVYFSADLQRQGRTLFANQVLYSPINARLHYHRSNEGLELEVLEEFQLEWSPSLDAEVWQAIEAKGRHLITTQDPTGFFRLRKFQ